MNKLVKCFIVISLLMLSLTSVPQAAESEKETSWISSGQELGLGPWWKKTAHRFDPIPDPLLYHLEGSIAFTKLSGNVDAEIMKADADLFLRKRLLTSLTSFHSTANDTELNMKNKQITVDKYDFNQMLAYDISDKLSFGGGFMWKRDNARFLLDRWTYYLGANYSFFIDPPFILKLGAYYGYEDNTYDTDYIEEDSAEAAPLWDLPQVGGMPETYDSDGIRFMENMTIMLNERVVFLHSFDYMMYMKDSKYYHWNTAFTIQVGITKTISFFTRYEINYEKSLLAERYGNFFQAMKDHLNVYGYDVVAKDEAIIAGLKFSL
ncbi:DUF481 domain-containing protein [Desulfamplus magnetovallimortis]|nr:DUF481 domain-containing protein [Desulfamplus magnetovallimortis]